MRARYYNPLLRRFLNVDPAREGWNWYGYAGGNPIAFVDPTGLGISSALDAVQNTLSFLGMIPVVGNIFDAINVGISIGRGDYAGAAINIASALPGAGLGAGALAIGSRTGRRAFSGFASDVLNPANYNWSGRTNAILGLPVPSGAARNNLVYQSIDRAAGKVNYVGITRNFAARQSAHARLKGIQIQRIDGLSGLSRFDARSVEQVLIERHGLSRNNGTLLNLINSIAPNNPIYRKAIKRGEEILEGVGL
ncbi:hypothetical protein Rhal01_03854 [Rubritalea halochordaticola]|uniref:RHS repeat-associated core domain-containing protein n=2 Tax=Rubritalea halochordaticola TaxID=714537 RepID=A0ABP9V4Q6_9BACT